MAKFLNTSATTYYLEELIKNAGERLILISPYLQLNARIKELLTDKDRMKIDVRIVYRKNKLQTDEGKWLSGLNYIRTSFCENLHAKCYLNESSCIITSMNLYEFSQVNNNEMGVCITRDEDAQVYKDAYDEAQRLIRISDENSASFPKPGTHYKKKLPSSKIAAKHNLSTKAFLQLMVDCKFLEQKEEGHYLADAGKKAGGEFKYGEKTGREYFLWPEEMLLPKVKQG